MVEGAGRREDVEKVDKRSLFACICGGVGVERGCVLVLDDCYERT